MKAVFWAIALLFLYPLSLSAQKGLPSFGKVDKADLLITDCDFDKGASAMVLIDWGKTYYGRGTVGYSTFKTFFERRTRIKILNEEGIEQADIRIPYYNRNNEEKITRLNANTYNLDASGKVQVTDVKKSSIYSKQIDASHALMIITFPEVKIGSIIEYSYTIERETIYLSDWPFQRSIPVCYSEYQLNIPQFFRFTSNPNVVDPIENKQEVVTETLSADEGMVETKVLKNNYIMRNLVGIKDESFMGAAKDYMQRIEFQLSQIDYGDRSVDIRTKWSDIVNKLRSDESFGVQLEKTIPSANALIIEAKQVADTEARMKFLYDRLRKDMNWNEEDGIYSNNGISKTWETKSGSHADINLLLIKLLTDAGIKALPILFSTRDHGLTVTTYISEDQFNTVMAYVIINDKYFVLDATNKIIQYKLIPEEVVNTNGFIMDGEGGRWKEILSDKYHYKVITAVQGDIDAEGKMNGIGLVNCYDYARLQRCQAWNSSQSKFKENYFLNPYPSMRIEELSINNVDADSLPLEQKVKFSSILNRSGDYRYFSVNLFSDLEKNPFVADNRVSDVDFGVHQDYTIFGNYTIPQDFVFDGLPESIVMTMPDKGIIFNRTVKAEENLLNVRITIEFKRTFYPAANYPEFAAFYKKLFEKLNEQVVIKKKSVP